MLFKTETSNFVFPFPNLTCTLSYTHLNIKLDWFVVLDASLVESSHLSNYFSHFYSLTQFIFANAWGWSPLADVTCCSPSLLLARQPEAELLLLVSGCDASWLPPAALNSPYVPTEIKPPVMWILKKQNKKRRLHISFNSFSQMHYSDSIICWELRGSQRCSSTTEGRGLFKCLWLFSPPHRQTRGRRLLFNVFTASRFSSELSTFLNFTQPEIKWCVCRCRCSWEDAGGTFWSLTIRLESLDRKKNQQLFFSSKPLKWLMATKDEHLNP